MLKYLLNMKKLKVLRLSIPILTLVLAFSFSVSQAFADKEKENEKVTYRLRYKYPMSVTNVYKMVENTSVTRQYKDSTSLKYERTVNYFYTIKQLVKMDDNFVKVHVTLDSLQYSFKDGDALFEFDSQSEAQGSINFDDLNDYLIPLSKEFDMTYSPYGEVIKVEGGNLDNLIQYIKKATSEQMDSLDQQYWLNMLSLNRLQYIVDPIKLTVPSTPATKDSVWLSTPLYCVDGIYFKDTVSTHIAKVVSNYFDIESEFEDFSFVPGDYKFYGIKDLRGNIVESKAKG